MHLDRSYDYIFAALAAPFTGEGEVKTLDKKPGKPRYVTARTVMNRLDNVLGPQNWWDEYVPYSEHAIICKLSVRLPDGTVLTKSDAGGMAGMSDQGDDDKSGFSDAFKRSAVKFGIARYLRGDGVPDYRPQPEPVTTARPEPVVAPWKEEPATLPAPAAPQVQAQAKEEPTQAQAEPESQGLNGLDGTSPFKQDRTFWNDILDEVSRVNSGWMADHPDSEEIVTTTRVLKALAEITYEAKVHPVDPAKNIAPDSKPMTEARWAGVLNKVAKKSPELHTWLKEHLEFFCNQQFQAAQRTLTGSHR